MDFPSLYFVIALYEHMAADISILHLSKYCLDDFNKVSTKLKVRVTPSLVSGIKI